MERLRAKINPEDKILIEESYALADRIHFLLEKHHISQKELAERLGKSESEISKWLSGGHNFTSHTLVKIGIAVGERVYSIPSESEQKIEEIEKLANVLKSSILRAFKHHIKVNYKYTKFDGLSELEVSSTGVIVNKNHEHIHQADFVQAELKPELFKNIERSSLN
jgi:transcriptional regulator with XRE-family HTH domain